MSVMNQPMTAAHRDTTCSDTEQKSAGTSSVECSVEGCSKSIKATGLCATHYQRKRRTGNADTVRKPGPKPRNGRDPMTRPMIYLYGLGTASPRSESRWTRTNRIIHYLDALAYEQYGCQAQDFGCRVTKNRKGYFPNFAGELEYAEVLLWAADNDPDAWLRIVNEVCDEYRARMIAAGYEPHCEGNHGVHRPALTMTTPRRIRLSRNKGWRKPAGAVVVSRPTRYGNPFTASGDRALAAAQFREWLEGPHNDRITAEDLESLRGKDLCCWCPLDGPCHADVLLELANR